MINTSYEKKDEDIIIMSCEKKDEDIIIISCEMT